MARRGSCDVILACRDSSTSNFKLLTAAARARGSGCLCCLGGNYDQSASLQAWHRDLRLPSAAQLRLSLKAHFQNSKLLLNASSLAATQQRSSKRQGRDRHGHGRTHPATPGQYYFSLTDFLHFSLCQWWTQTRAPTRGAFNEINKFVSEGFDELRPWASCFLTW